MVAAAATAPTERVVIDQYVDGVADYRVTIHRYASSIVTIKGEPTERPDATFRQSAETARAIASGATDSHQAFLLGHVRFVGNIELLIERRDAFLWLEETLAPILALTTFDDE